MCSSGIGAIGNVYALVSSIGPYPAWIWASLLLFKLIVIVAAVMLLRMQKVAVWLYLAVFVAEMALSIFVTRPYTRSEEHTSELQSLMRNSYADFCLIKIRNNTSY